MHNPFDSNCQTGCAYKKTANSNAIRKNAAPPAKRLLYYKSFPILPLTKKHNCIIILLYYCTNLLVH